MNIAVLDDYQDTIRSLACFSKVAGHNVTIWKDHTKDVDALAGRLKDAEVLALIRERTPITAPLLDRLPALRLICQAGVVPHIDLEACTRHGVIVSSNTAGGRPSYATAELTWGLIIAAFRRIPQEMAALKAGRWQAYPIGIGLRGKTLGIFGYGKIGAVVAGYGKAFGMNVIAWGRQTTLDKARADGYQVAPSKDEFFAQSDVVSLHLRLIPETRGAGGGAARRPSGHGRGRRVRGRARCGRAAPAAGHGQRRQRAASRLRGARRARAHVQQHLRRGAGLCSGQADQRVEP